MAQFKIWLCSGFIAVGLFSSVSASEKNQKPEWNAKMAELLRALSDTIPDLFIPSVAPSSAPSIAAKDETRMVSPEFRERVKRIYDLSRSIDQNGKHATKAPDSDPGLAFVSQMFREDMERAYQSLDNGSAEYSKGILKASVSYCIACHTRTQDGAQFPLIGTLEKSLEKAPWIDRVAFKAATRQFDDAYSEVMTRFEPGATASKAAFETERAARIGLTIAVRVKDSPERALLLAERVSRSELVSASVRGHAKTWIDDVRKWQAEKPRKLGSDRELMTAAREILKRGDLLDGPRADGAEIRYLRASNLMHRLLREHPKSELIPEALFMIGLAYDSLGDVGIWNLSDMYYQACVHGAPHTERAQQCFRRYEENVIFGFSGSSGTRIPFAVQTHLRQIKDLATVKGARQR